MPLVFVHGVKNRIGSSYQEATAAREALFRRFALAGLCPHPDRATVLSPYWGGHAAEFAWDLACLPEDDAESLGAADSDPEVSPLAAALRAHAGQQAPPDRILAAAAGADFPGTIDLLFAAGAVEADVDAAEFAEAAARAAAYADAHPVGPAWVAEAATDDDFLDRLENDIENTTAMPTGAGGQEARASRRWGPATSWVRSGQGRTDCTQPWAARWAPPSTTCCAGTLSRPRPRSLATCSSTSTGAAPRRIPATSRRSYSPVCGRRRRR